MPKKSSEDILSIIEVERDADLFESKHRTRLSRGVPVSVSGDIEDSGDFGDVFVVSTTL